MDRTTQYANILTEILYAESAMRFPLSPELQMVAACDYKTGQFLLIMIGWKKDEWVHSITFHARLIEGKVLIEADMTEGLKPRLLEAGIRAEDFISDLDYDYRRPVRVAA
ncbi:MAG TPA: element excision factor XisI family protein [Blastocatellia bacterium]|nr:element excision factor XisI family protein [Blastocatellia bacterium]HMV81752.1 element excision factor XisI family protein [Blastocatellia bacterium]HMX26256.1 element excision factor XisI family protein [Blastocatellia bacterium]HMY71232.1 element excision factor XisI family protein [Blastocatellia bacterium]HMZ18187.1 element excision factor XisI family protein [Blastocatellia bacterium]